jgi:microcystin-dependent protein
MPQTGMVLLYGSDTPPTGWLLCRGQSLDTTTYADLFAITAYKYGGSGANFNLPDLQDAFPKGSDGSTPIFGTTGGGSVTLSDANLVGHTHSISADGEHNHNLFVEFGGGPSHNLVHTVAAGGSGISTTTGTEPDHQHGGATGATGSDTAITILPEYLALNYIIKF